MIPRFCAAKTNGFTLFVLVSTIDSREPNCPNACVKISPGQIDSQWTDVIKDDFIKWLEKHPEEGKMTRAQLDEIMKKRTW